MRTIGASLTTHIAGETTTLATCWLVTRTDATVYAFTDHDRPLVIDGTTYAAAGGYTASDIVTSNGLDVDNLELHGVLDSPSITEDDLRAGRWDFAAYRIFMVNWSDLTQGEIKLRAGRLGEVRTTERGKFVAELRGLAQAYSRIILRIDGPGCSADLGDARCGVDIDALSVTGTVDSVSSDGLTIYDAARAEDGPADPISITGVTLGDPTIITAPEHGLFVNAIVYISDIVGTTELNGQHRIYNPTGETFELAIDSTAYSAYVSGGTISVPRESGGGGTFDGGRIAMTSGAADGLSMEIKSYVPGAFVLQLPFPYTIAASDTYTAWPGCGKSLGDCKDRYDNVVNFRGFPYLPGLDRLIETA